MKMNALEHYAMNNPLRAWFLRTLEFPVWKSFGIAPADGPVLEIGCGTGLGRALIAHHFQPKMLVATDFDMVSISAAKRKPDARLMHHAVADAASLPFPDATFAVVIEGAAIHHVGDWRRSIREIARVLVPGGLFYFEEVSKCWIRRFPYRQLFAHPQQDRFDGAEFVTYLRSIGISVGDRYTELRGGDFFFGKGART